MIKSANKGPSVARNIGIKNSIGEFIFFVDSNYLEIGSFSNKKVLSPKVLIGNDSKIVISAALNFPSIMSDVEKLGIDKGRIIKGLII